MRASRLGRGRAVGFDANYVAGFQSPRTVNAQSLTISGSRAKSLGGAAPSAPAPSAPAAGVSDLPSDYGAQIQASFGSFYFGGLF